MAKIPDIHIDLEDLNDTELVALAKWCGLPASRALPRERLIASLDAFTPVDVEIPIDEKRKKLSTWLTRWWDMVRMQVPKKVCPDCNSCRDLQVLDCYTRNAHNIDPKKRRR